MLYEERRIRLRSGAFPDYRRWVHSTLWPALEAAGHAPLCLLNGLIGAAVEDVVLIVSAQQPPAVGPRAPAPPESLKPPAVQVGFADFEARMAAQPLLVGAREDAAPPRSLIESEDVHVLLPSAYRPDSPPLPENRRAVYGVRRWWIHPVREGGVGGGWWT